MLRKPPMSLRGGAKRRRRNLVVNAICHGIATLTAFARNDSIKKLIKIYAKRKNRSI